MWDISLRRFGARIPLAYYTMTRGFNGIIIQWHEGFNGTCNLLVQTPYMVHGF